MTDAIHQQGTRRGGGGFSRGAVLAMVVVGFAAFIALLYFIGAGDTRGDSNNGQAHAEANGLNGYSGLVKLLEARGETVSISRTPSSLETTDLLVLTPPPYLDTEEFEEILQKRAYLGPTLVILPKWFAYGFPPGTRERVDQDIKKGWVQLGGSFPVGWTDELSDYYKFETTFEEDVKKPESWAGLELNGTLPDTSLVAATDIGNGTALVVDGSSNALAFWLNVQDEWGESADTEAVTFVVEPDLMNNYGMADPDRAAVALALISDASYDSDYPITFDMTLNGFGGSTNLLTLAFRPPFLAATLCLILAILIVGWRAFKRFGPPVASGPEIAFGKRRLVANGAGLILRARRLRLLAEPYAALSARRLASRLGLSKPDPEAIDDALRIRLPEEPPYSLRAQELRKATKPSEILRAARALKDLEGKLAK